VITPHIGGAVGDNFPVVVDRAFRNVSAVLAAGDVADADKVVWLR
jgi:hypothetical protein